MSSGGEATPVRVAIVGTGYVGLVSGACLAELGHDVTCVDLDREKVDRVNRGESPIFEEGLEPLLHRHVPGRLRATTDVAAAVRGAEVVFLAVGTPFDGAAIDLGQIVAACEQVGAALAAREDYCAVVVRSTVVPGTTDGVVVPALERASGKRAGTEFGVGMNPEFLREGRAVEDFLRPGRIVLGGVDERTLDALGRVYAVFPDTPKLRTNNKTAEMIKYASNAFFATLISFSNEFGNLCSAVGDVDVVDVMAGLHLDERVSPELADGTRVRPSLVAYLAAGCGFGGSCFPKDVNSLLASARDAGVEMPVLDAVMRTNDAQPSQLLRLLGRRLPSLRDRTVAVLGLAFKEGTDDIRGSPAIPILRALHELGARSLAYDPVARPTAERELNGDVAYAGSLEEAVEAADAILLVTPWPEFRRLPELLLGREPQPVVVDGRRMLDRRLVPVYEGIGL